MKTRWVYVTLIGEEEDYPAPPTDRPSLRVEIISRRGGTIQERTYTYNTPEGASVAPPGAGWVFKEVAGYSSVWVRVREQQQTSPRHEPEVMAATSRKTPGGAA